MLDLRQPRHCHGSQAKWQSNRCFYNRHSTPLIPFTFFTPMPRGRHVSKKTQRNNLPLKSGLSSSNRGISKLHWSEMPSKQKVLVCLKTATKILY